MEDVTLITADTEVTANDPGSYSMVSTFVGGNAARLAAIDARKKLFQIAAEAMEANPGDLVLRDKKIFVVGSPDKSLPLKKAVRMGLIQGKPVSGEGHFAPKVDHRLGHAVRIAPRSSPRPAGPRCGCLAAGLRL